MREQGVVTRLDGRSATVMFAMGEGCAHCDSSSECSVNDRTVETELAEGVSVSVGDFVTVEVAAKARTAGLLWLVAAPLALFAGGYALVPVLSPGAGEGLSALGGILGFALGLLAATVMTRRGAMAGKPVVTGPASLPGHQPDAEPGPEA